MTDQCAVPNSADKHDDIYVTFSFMVAAVCAFVTDFAAVGPLRRLLNEKVEVGNMSRKTGEAEHGVETTEWSIGGACRRWLRAVQVWQWTMMLTLTVPVAWMVAEAYVTLWMS